MRLLSVAGARIRRAAEEEERTREREPPPPQPPSHHSNHQFNSMKNKFFNELTHLPSEHLHTRTNKTMKIAKQCKMWTFDINLKPAAV